MAHLYAHLFRPADDDVPVLHRLWALGRPDMALFVHARHFAGEPIEVYNHGDMRRDFTYIDDLVEGIRRDRYAAKRPEEAAAIADGDSSLPWRLIAL